MQTLYQSPEKLLEIYKSLNFDFRQQAVVQVSVPFKVGQWLDSRLTLVGMWLRDKDSDFYDLPFDRRTLAGVAVLNATFKLPVKPDLRLTLNGFCQTGAIQGIYDLPTSGNLGPGPYRASTTCPPAAISTLACVMPLPGATASSRLGAKTSSRRPASTRRYAMAANG